MKKKYRNALFISLLLLIITFSGCGLDSQNITSVSGITVLDSTAAQTTSLPDDSSLEVHFIDVGQADSALILCDGDAMLIDGGNVEDSNLIYSYLQARNIDHLDAVVVTHAHEDHCGGISGALSYASVETLYCPVTSYDSKAFNNVLAQLEKQDKSITVPAPGDSFYIGNALVSILGPINETDNTNNTSIVLRIDYGNTSFLFTGDAEYEEEQDILNAGYDISCNVLKAGHHGSSTSSSYQWLRAADPDAVVISCGTDNSYGHPHEEVLSRLRDAEVKVYRTDMQGDIIATSDGQNISFTVNKNKDANTLTGSGAGGNHPSSDNPDSIKENTSDKMEQDNITYVLNTNSKKFHFPNCNGAKKISAHNRKEVDLSREELINSGFAPCGLCKP